MPPQLHSTSSRISAGFVLLAGVSAIGLLLARTQTELLSLAFITAFFGYYWLCRFPPSFRYVLGLGIAVRLLLFIGMPTLSDDIYRFLWDGLLAVHGMNPFDATPTELITHQALPQYFQVLYPKLNSPDYFSVYPPLNQALFYLAAYVGESNGLMATNALRLFLLAAEIGSFLIIRKLLLFHGKSPDIANWYFLNPLVILEIVGNVHFEGLTLFFVLLGILLWYRKSSLATGVSLGLAIAVKLVPLIFLPVFLFKIRERRALLVLLAAGATALISLLPLLGSDLVNGIGSSLNLYFQKFEFNASMYYLFREIGYWKTGYNMIGMLGPYLSILTLLSILSIADWGKRTHQKLASIFLFSLFAYLALATTVHPWYIVPLVAFGILSGYYFPIIWSFMIFVTYFGYSGAGYELSLWWIVLEYTVVFATLFYELVNKSNSNEV